MHSGEFGDSISVRRGVRCELSIFVEFTSSAPCLAEAPKIHFSTALHLSLRTRNRAFLEFSGGWKEMENAMGGVLMSELTHLVLYEF